jgi:hypothetical protein
MALEAMNYEKKLEILLASPCTSRHCTLHCKNAEEGACRAVVAAEIAGQPLHAQRSLAKRNRFRLSESGHFLAISRANRGGTCARSVPCAGELALWRIASLELPHGRPTMEEGVKCGLLRGVQNLGLDALSRADFWAELARSVFRVQGD